MSNLTEQDLERVATAVAKKTVEELFEKFGMDVTDVRGTQADFIHLRKTRLASERVSKWVAGTAIAACITGAFSTLILGIKTYFQQ